MQPVVRAAAVRPDMDRADPPEPSEAAVQPDMDRADPPELSEAAVQPGMYTAGPVAAAGAAVVAVAVRPPANTRHKRRDRRPRRSLQCGPSRCRPGCREHRRR